MQWKFSGQTLVFQDNHKLFEILNDKNMYSIQWIQGTLCFSGQAQVAKKSWKVKNVSTPWKVLGQLCFSRQESCSKIWMIKNQWRAVRGGKGVPPLPKRYNYGMILIIFIVNTFEFAYFFLKSGGSHEGRQRLLVPPLTRWLSHWAVCHKLWWWALAVQLPLCQLCNLQVSNSVMFVYTFNICTPSAFHGLALTWRCV